LEGFQTVTMTPFRVAVVQHPPVFLNLAQSLERACALVEQAVDGGAKIVAFPETWLPGYPVWLDHAPRAALWDHAPAKALYRLLTENAMRFPGRCLERLLALGRRTGAYLVVGVHERAGGTLYNTTLTVGTDGATYRLHRKLVPTYTERLIWGRGDGSTLGVLETEHGILGGLICWEHWMPLARAAMHAKGEVVHVAGWPSVGELHQLASRHYAFEAQCFVLAAGSVLSRGEVREGFRSLGSPDGAAGELLDSIPGTDADLLLNGGSAIVGPDAQYLAGPVFDEPCILYADLNPGRILEGHLTLDTAGHYSRPDLFDLRVSESPQTGVTFESHRA
jgi:predicted amidohydrolase